MSDLYENTIIGIEPGDNGEKAVHFFGYGYCSEDFDTETPYRFLEYTWFIVPLKDVLKEGVSVSEGLRFFAYEENHVDDYKQYITDCTEEEMYDIYNHYDNGKQPTAINIEDITEDTPYGCYIVI